MGGFAGNMADKLTFLKLFTIVDVETNEYNKEWLGFSRKY